MRNINNKGHAYKSLAIFSGSVVIWILCLVGVANAQRGAQAPRAGGVIEAGTTINVRTIDAIDARDSDGRVFSGEIDQDVPSRSGNVAIPRGSRVDLNVKRVSDNEIALDLDSVTIAGQRYGIDTDDNVVTTERRDGLGGNERTGKYVGGGALLGAIIGAVTGGGKGAAIGAGAGAAAGAGAQVLTRGGHINVPAESLLTFRLAQSLRAGRGNNNGVSRDRGNINSNGTAAFGNDSPAYREGLRAGRSDSERNLPRNTQSDRWSGSQDRRDYLAGYNEGYQQQARGPAVNRGRDTGRDSNARGVINVRGDNNVNWEGPSNSKVFVKVDNEAPKLFASGPSGTLAAPWIAPGHVYVFILQDPNGNEIARDQRDLRSGRGR